MAGITRAATGAYGGTLVLTRAPVT
eukprot:COSAG01_NODE_31244_length_601_cov_0.804781_1_plen_24_part_01